MSDITTPDVSFEDFSHENGITYWLATEFMGMLGYPNMASFAKPLKRAMQACLAVNIDTQDNFNKIERMLEDASTITDYKLTRFACYMIAMNGDSKKPEIAKAQTYFASQAEKIHLMLVGTGDIDRVITRADILEGNKALQSAAAGSGVTKFGLFHDAGYRGLYNSSLSDIKKKKGLKQTDNLMDFIGRTELAANLFRITLTEENLKNAKVVNEKHASSIHNQVGKDVRAMVIKNTGVAPENLKTEKKINEAAKQLKKVNKEMNRIDKKR
ncbi:MAG: damage-inducible protein [Bacteroidetes bacterium]|nr:damage-inducible protein [Bacteroidota bacterium]